jgi:hypothetical protein
MLNNMGDDLLDFGGEYYYFDFKEIDNFLSTDKSYASQVISEQEVSEMFNPKGESMGQEVITKSFPKGKEIDVSRFEIFRMFLEIVLTYDEVMDDALGANRLLTKSSLPFKLAFNTLMKEGILKQL